MKLSKLLSRDEFRNSVFLRDNHKCVVCGEEAVDAHHIMERRLWYDGGYYIDNGASLCETHHIESEMTLISVEDLREKCGITHKMIPLHMYDDQIYDKWSNIILANGTRLKGELFYDESVQKILERGKVLGLFTDYVKYPRTHHLPWSENISNDDRIISSLDRLRDVRVIVTEKMDGENTTMYLDHIHARSLDSQNHPSRNWVKQFWSTIKADIPKGWRVCGENLYAKHSIGYENLDSYFYGISIWNDRNECLSWEDSIEWFNLLNIKSMPVIYDGIFNEYLIQALYGKDKWNSSEGYVVRIADKFSYNEFKYVVGKYVRERIIFKLLNTGCMVKKWK